MNHLPNIKEDGLLMKLQHGEHTAFETLFWEFQPALVFFANRMLYQQALAEAEEIVNDVFLKFYARRTDFNSLQSIKAFLYIATKNACLQSIEKEKTRKRRSDAFATSVELTEDAVIDGIIYAETLREVSQAIELLPAQCRAVMERFFDGKKAAEISGELNITVSTVNNQKARAISLLRKNLSGAGLLFILTQL